MFFCIFVQNWKESIDIISKSKVICLWTEIFRSVPSDFDWFTNLHICTAMPAISNNVCYLLNREFGLDEDMKLQFDFASSKWFESARNINITFLMWMLLVHFNRNLNSETCEPRFKVGDLMSFESPIQTIRNSQLRFDVIVS